MTGLEAVEDRFPLGTICGGRDRRRHLVLVRCWEFRGEHDWYADQPSTRNLPGYNDAPEVRR